MFSLTGCIVVFYENRQSDYEVLVQKLEDLGAAALVYEWSWLREKSLQRRVNLHEMYLIGLYFIPCSVDKNRALFSLGHIGKFLMMSVTEVSVTSLTIIGDCSTFSTTNSEFRGKICL